MTKKLYHNHLTPETATNLLLDLFVVINSCDTKTCKRCGRDLKIECPKCDKDFD